MAAANRKRHGVDRELVGGQPVRGAGRNDPAIVLRKPAQTVATAARGKLYVTSHRVVFCPHLIDAALGGDTAAYRLADLEVAEVRTPATDGQDEYGGGETPRLVLESRDARTVYFVLDDPGTAARAIIDAITAETGKS